MFTVMSEIRKTAIWQTLRSLCAAAVVMLSFSVPGFSQSRELKGHVYDSGTGEPMTGVFVVDQATKKGVMTGPDGSYTINVDNGTELLFSILGYKEYYAAVGERDKLDVFLDEDKEELEATVIVGYGSQKKASSVAALTQTTGEELLQASTGVTNITEALQGMMPGVISINTNSMPGDENVDIMIRGKATWQDASPLILVDGVERDMNNVSMNEIDKITVLKDASATAVYGVKGANGVILITTKQGMVSKPRVNFNANFGLKQMTSHLDWADPITTMEMWNEAAYNDGLWDSMVTESVIDAWRENIDEAGPYNQYFPLVNMWDEITKPVGFSHSYGVDVYGGTNFMKYYAYVGYTRDGDIFRTEKNDLYDSRFYYERYNWRSNFTFNITKTTTLAVRLSGFMGTQNSPGFKISGDNWGVSDFYEKIYFSPTFEFPLQYEDGTIGEAANGYGNIQAVINNSGQRTAKRMDSFTDILLDQDLSFITKGLSFSGKISYTIRTRRNTTIYEEGAKNAGINNVPNIRYYRKYDLANPIYNEDGTVDYPLLINQRYPNDEVQDPVVLGDYDQFSMTQQKLYFELALNYARSFGKHNVTALALMNRNKAQYSKSATKIDFPRHEESWVGRITYNYAERYLMEVNAAYNGSEKFAPGKRFGLFPSFSVGWRLSEEPFIKKRFGRWLDEFKVRYSYGIVGSDAGAQRFNYIQIYNTAAGIKFGDVSPNQSTPIYTEGNAADPNATWERAVKQNLGFEISLFSRLDLNLDFFHEARSGILMQYKTIPLWVGVLNPVGNIGKTKNRGFEIELNWHDKIGKDFNYWIKANWTMNQNRIVFRDDPKKRADYMKDAGKPIDWVSAYLMGGYYDSIDDIFNSPEASLGTVKENLIPGDISYIDFNADGVIDILDKAPLDNVTYPMNTGGLTLGMEYKGFSVNVMFYGVFNQIKALNKTLWDFPQGIMKGQEDILGRWTPENAANSKVVKPVLHLSYGNHSQNQQGEFCYRKADYVRLKNAEIAYSFPIKMIKKIGLSKLQIYANGNNLFTFTSLDKRLDPETADTSVYPLVRRYNFGVRLTF